MLLLAPSLSMSSTDLIAIVLEGANTSKAPDCDKASRDFLPPSLISIFFEKVHKSLKFILSLMLQT